jgi:hypothetical protein
MFEQFSVGVAADYNIISILMKILGRFGMPFFSASPCFV